jgi:(S)-ureidoglycine aminohydrolase
MEISALTRSVVKSNHAVIAPDGYINSNVPGWSNCTVNVIINEAMGAGLCQTLITANQNCTLKGKTVASQVFFYVVSGNCSVSVNGTNKDLKTGQFVYVPIEKEYSFTNVSEGTQILTFHKVYEMLEGFDVPEVPSAKKTTPKRLFT